MKIDGEGLSKDEQQIYSAAFALEASKRVYHPTDHAPVKALNMVHAMDIHETAASAVRYYRLLVEMVDK